jgi:hypothetical protein
MMINVWKGAGALIVIVFLLSGCSPSQLQDLREGALGLGSCSLHTSLGCVSQAIGACAIPSEDWGSEDWGSYASCVADKSGKCSAAGLAKCTVSSAIRAAGGPVAMGGVACSQAAVLECVNDTTIETEVEALSAVAACQRMVCLNGE